MFETTKKAHTKLQKENTQTKAELGETKDELSHTKGELSSAKVEVEESSHLLDEFERAQGRVFVPHESPPGTLAGG